ncbi:MAG: HPP family protein [Polynucleobacter sp.]|uniref:HPP family protein n=1 Tax=Polynucleobacter sp. TaxID=2029855 RepID=UPI00271BD575|nr:HPP family protein [Polynucleobacter sp.]MDO8714583.1 HPP family protein [Polynucleobacter sp.]
MGNFLFKLKRYIPLDPYGYSWLEILRICFVIDILILAVVMFNEVIGSTEQNTPVIAAFPVMALMMFLMPSSRIFHPKAIIEGNVVSALLATASGSIFSSLFFAMPVAVIASAIAMYGLRCFSPTALLLAMLISAGNIDSYYFAIFPIFSGSIVLVATAYLYGKLTKKSYPISNACK